MKLCPTCKVREIRGKGQAYCSDCHNSYQKAYYKKHPKSIDESNKRRKQVLRNYLRKRKDFPCTGCGIKYPYYVMDFDHLRDKKFDLSIGVNRLYSLKKIENEISKCELVCANCHRERTFKNIGM